MIDLSRLEKIKERGNKLQAACPACRSQGHDRSGNHLVIYRGEDGSFQNGPFACVANPGDSDHRKDIFGIVGVKDLQKGHHLSSFTADEKRRRIETQAKRQREKIEAETLTKLSNRIESQLLETLNPFRSKDWRANYFHQSPCVLDAPELAPAWLLKCLFMPSDIVWLGFRMDSGKQCHRDNFKPLSEWMEHVDQGGEIPPYFAAGTFKPGSFSRCRDNLTSAPFILVECDEIIGYKPSTEEDKQLNKELSAALVGFLRSHGLNLRALIDTGNKSLHAIFDCPPHDELEALRRLAKGFRMDTGPIEQCAFSPLRLPGAIHEKSGKAASLIYLSQKGAA